MKTIATLIFIAFVLLPFAITIFSGIARIVANRREAGTKPTLAIPLKLVQLRSRRRLLYLVGSFYGVGLFAAALFFFLEVIAPAFSLQQKGIIFVGIFMLILVVASSIGVFTFNRYVSRINPVPEEGFTAKSRLEWWNKSADIYGRNIGRWLLYVIGFTLLALAVLVLAFYFLG